MADRLSEYRSKRTPGKTPEPMEAAAPTDGPLLFVIQKHAATNLHYDLRLELGGTLKSWAVPRGPSSIPEDKRFAAETEDHPYGYAAFEGVIPKGEYGAGEMIVWDLGTWFPDELCDPRVPELWQWQDPAWRAEIEAKALAAIEEGKLSVFFRGERMRGSWALVKTKEGWLFFKHRDRWANLPGELIGPTTSVLSGRTLEDVARGEKAPPFDLGSVRLLKPEAWPTKLLPMKADSAHAPFDRTGWMFEPKLDGIRALVHVRNGEARIFTRHGMDQTSQFPELARHLAEQRGNMILDGEIVAFEDGKPGFTAMMKRFHLKDAAALEVADRAYPCLFYAFDLLHLDGYETRSFGNRQRRDFLRRVLLTTERVKLIEHLDDHGLAFYRAVVAAGFEGAMAKKADARYDASGKRSANWLKIKFSTTAEFVVGAVQQGEGSRASTFGALVLGYYDGDVLTYAGRVGSGFNDVLLEDLKRKFEPLATKENPFGTPVELDGPATWVRPEIVVEVKFGEIMPSGHIRTPVFVRERPDVVAGDVGPPVVVRPPAEADVPVPDEPTVPGSDVLAQLGGKEKNLILEVEGVKLSLTNLDKPLWPATDTQAAFTKRDMLRYLTLMSPWMLEHTRDRPMTMIRWPNGIHGEKFFQKHIESGQGRPDFVDVIELWGDTNKKNQEYVNCNRLATLLWMGQLGTLEFHVPAARVVPGPDGEDLSLKFNDSDENLEASILNYPDFIRFDLDPYIYSGLEKPGDEPELNREAFEKCKTVAIWIKQMLDALGWPCYAKTTGKTGLHLFVPIVRNIDTQAARAMCGTICNAIVGAHPRETTVEWSVPKRTGKVFLDFNMNALGKTLGAAYSPRALANQSMSMPVTWEELPNIYPDDFVMRDAASWLTSRGDAWAGMLDAKVDLTKL